MTRWLLLSVTLTGCGGSPPLESAAPPPPEPGRPPGPVAVVAEFLDAAGRREHWAMASRFGTADGPLADRSGALVCGLRRAGSWLGVGDRCASDAEVEIRMDLIASALAHDSYSVLREARVVGKGRPARLVEVELEGAGRVVTVPFVVVLARGARWLVEEVGLKGLM